MTPRRLLLPGLVLGLVVGLAGCGGSEPEPDATSTPTSTTPDATSQPTTPLNEAELVELRDASAAAVADATQLRLTYRSVTALDGTRSGYIVVGYGASDLDESLLQLDITVSPSEDAATALPSLPSPYEVDGDAVTSLVVDDSGSVAAYLTVDGDPRFADQWLALPDDQGAANELVPVWLAPSLLAEMVQPFTTTDPDSVREDQGQLWFTVPADLAIALAPNPVRSQLMLHGIDGAGMQPVPAFVQPTTDGLSIGADLSTLLDEAAEAVPELAALADVTVGYSLGIVAGSVAAIAVPAPDSVITDVG